MRGNAFVSDDGDRADLPMPPEWSESQIPENVVVAKPPALPEAPPVNRTAPTPPPPAQPPCPQPPVCQPSPPPIAHYGKNTLVAKRQVRRGFAALAAFALTFAVGLTMGVQLRNDRNATLEVATNNAATTAGHVALRQQQRNSPTELTALPRVDEQFSDGLADDFSLNTFLRPTESPSHEKPAAASTEAAASKSPPPADNSNVKPAAEARPPKVPVVAKKAPKVTAPLVNEATCNPERKLGTTLVWASSPAAAAKLAYRQQRLLYMIHVSGNFEIPEFT